MRGAHNKAFTVAKVTKLDLLNDIHKSIAQSMRDGTGFGVWKKNITPTLQKHGWFGKTEAYDPRTHESKTIKVDARRLKTIYYTNVTVAYQKQRAAPLRSLPFSDYWIYKSTMNKVARETHKANNNHAYHRDDPFWDT
jgi:uncharacterized protein with gpF-like domain